TDEELQADADTWRAETDAVYGPGASEEIVPAKRELAGARLDDALKTVEIALDSPFAPPEFTAEKKSEARLAKSNGAEVPLFASEDERRAHVHNRVADLLADDAATTQQPTKKGRGRKQQQKKST